jgi:glycosyltransferase involved in cell wall biosynthesis
MKKRIIVSVTNDLSTDQRVKKVCASLQELNYDILLVGRKLPESIELQRDYKCKRMALIFNKGALFYAEYNIRLFFLLLFSKVDVYHANDLDTLLANFLAASIRRKHLVYDSHEYFTGVPEIQNKPLVKGIWLAIERWIFPKLKHIITVNKSIAKLYAKEYEKEILIMRNMPPKRQLITSKSKAELGLPEDKKIIITQGAGINIDRGIEEAVEAMQYLKDVCFLIVGSGDVIPKLKQRVAELDLQNDVIFKDRMPYEEMMQYTQHAQLGLTLDKDTNINYRFSLPNKLFDYIHAGIPVLASRVIEVQNIIETYHVGLFIENHNPEHIAAQINIALNDEELKKMWLQNMERASNELNWEHEEITLKKVYSEIEG